MGQPYLVKVFFHLFFTILPKNSFGHQQDSNLDRQSRGRACQPLSLSFTIWAKVLVPWWWSCGQNAYRLDISLKWAV